jgi:hypothetical protein
MAPFGGPDGFSQLMRGSQDWRHAGHRPSDVSTIPTWTGKCHWSSYRIGSLGSLSKMRRCSGCGNSCSKVQNRQTAKSARLAGTERDTSRRIAQKERSSRNARDPMSAWTWQPKDLTANKALQRHSTMDSTRGQTQKSAKSSRERQSCTRTSQSSMERCQSNAMDDS